MSCPRRRGADGPCSDLLAALPLCAIPESLKVLNEAEKILKICQPSGARRIQAGAERISGQRLAETVAELPPLPHQEIDPDCNSQRQFHSVDFRRRRKRAD